MKNSKLVLTASMIILLNKAAWGMEEKTVYDATPHTSCTQEQAKTEKKGFFHDGTKSLFGSGEDTLDNLGKKYWRQEYGPGSDDDTESRWTQIAQKTKKPDHAKKLLQLAQERQWNSFGEDILESLHQLAGVERQTEELSSARASTPILLISYDKEISKEATPHYMYYNPITRENLDQLPIEPLATKDSISTTRLAGVERQTERSSIARASTPPHDEQISKEATPLQKSLDIYYNDSIPTENLDQFPTINDSISTTQRMKMHEFITSSIMVDKKSKSNSKKSSRNKQNKNLATLLAIQKAGGQS